MKMTQRNVKLSHALGLEELILLKWPHYPKQSTDLMKWKVKVAQSCPTLCDPTDFVHGILQATILEWPFLSSRPLLSLLQRIFPTQESNPGLPYCRKILYQLSHKGSSRILKWVAYPFCSRSSQPRDQTGVSCFTGGFFTNWAVWEAHI